MGPEVSPKAVLILACGNPSRGDDALGPELLARLEAEQAAGKLPEVDLITDFQLQVEHVVDLQGRSLVLFVDASVSAPEPFAFSPLRASSEVGYTTHTLSPDQLLAVFRQVNHQTSPPAFLLAIRGREFELGEPISPAAHQNLQQALKLVWTLLGEPRLEAWNELVDIHAPPRQMPATDFP